MDFNFELVLFYAVILTGIISLIDIIFFARKRKKDQKLPLISEYARGFFPILLLVFAIRSFGYEAFRIPSGSLKPTLLVGDFILVNKYNYGIRLPIIHKKIFAINEPQRGDIVVFHEPPLEKRYLIKRVIGLPGDHLVYKDKVLYINGIEATQTFVKNTTDEENNVGPWDVVQKKENLLGIEHYIFQVPNTLNDDFDIIVPPDHYFMMGDNRDESADSRYWGFLPEENIVGKATNVILSFDNLKHPLRFDRTWMTIN